MFIVSKPFAQHTQRMVLTMTPRRSVFALGAGVVALALLAARPVAPMMTNACSLINAGEAATALEVPNVHSEPMSPGDTTSCLWSNDPKFGDTARKVGVNTHSVRAYQMMKSSTATMITREPIAGLGDDAVYENWPHGSPFIWVLKGNYAFSIRILTNDKPAPFTTQQEKAKLLVLAKAAVTRM